MMPPGGLHLPAKYRYIVIRKRPGKPLSGDYAGWVQINGRFGAIYSQTDKISVTIQKIVLEFYSNPIYNGIKKVA